MTSPMEIFEVGIRICGFLMPLTSKSDFSEVGDPKGFHQGYHEMNYTKFGRGRSFCKNQWGGGEEEGELNSCICRIGHKDTFHLNIANWLAKVGI